MNNKELKFVLLDILRLDSIFQLLPYHERITVRGKLLGWQWAVLPERVQKLVAYLEQCPVNLPQLKIGQDRLTYVQIDDVQQFVGDYRKLHKDFEKELKKIIK